MNAAQVRETPRYHLVVSTIADRLEEVLKVRGLGSNELSRLAGLSEGFVSHAVTKSKKNPEADINAAKAVKIAKAARVNLEWLLTGEGPRDLPREDPPQVPYTIHARSSVGVADRELRVRLPSGASPTFVFGSLVNWPELLEGATRMRSNHSAWVWERVAAAPLFLAAEPSAAMVAQMADLVWAFERPEAAVAGQTH
jgi:hypothetical protein